MTHEHNTGVIATQLFRMTLDPQLLERHPPLSRAILRNPQDAEENTCETFATAWASAARFDATRGSVMGWLLLLCRSRAIDKLRRKLRQPVTIGLCRCAGITGSNSLRNSSGR